MKTFLSIGITSLALIANLTGQYKTAPQLKITHPASQQFNLTWQSKDQRPYFLEGSPDLVTWADASSIMIGDGAAKGITLTNTANKFFYRLREGAVRPGFDGSVLLANDDNSSNLVSLGFTVNIFGTTQTGCYVNNNGNISLGQAISGGYSYTPLPLQSAAQYFGDLKAMIAPFWADVDTRSAPDPDSGAKEVTYGQGTVNGQPAFGVNWIDVGYYSVRTDKLNSFQLILIRRNDTGADNFDIEFNYNRVLWETGNASGGVAGYGGSPSRSGLTNGVDRTIELAHSAETLVQLDSDPNTQIQNYSTGLIYRSRNSTVPGRFIFQVRSGSVLGALQVNAGNDISLSSGITTANLAGTAIDPSGGALTVKWTVLSTGSGNLANVSISNPNILTPTITIPNGETAVLQLTATSTVDPSITAADSMNITR